MAPNWSPTGGAKVPLKHGNIIALVCVVLALITLIIGIVLVATGQKVTTVPTNQAPYGKPVFQSPTTIP